MSEVHGIQLVLGDGANVRICGTPRTGRVALRVTKSNGRTLAVSDAAKLLSAVGGQRITAEMIQADVDNGAPTNANGTINLIMYAAWLVKQAVRPFDCSTVRNGAGVALNRPTAEQPNSLRAGGTHD